MLRQSLEFPLNRRATGAVRSLHVPLKGWSTRDQFAETKDSLNYAPILTNFFLNEGRLELVAGYEEHSQGLPDADVETLMEYTGGGVTKLFAAVGSEIYDVTGHGHVGAPDVTGLTNARLQHIMFATTSGQHLAIVNGADPFRTFNGSAWIERTITGVAASDLINISAHKTRLWFVQKNSLKAWYLGTYAVAGAANELNIGPLCKHGGSLVATGSWTYDGGDGPDDYFVMVTDQGEVVIYSGTDPASNYVLAGVFKVDKPLGKRCLEKYGADMVILTESGVVQLSKVLQSIAGKDSISDAIRDQFVKASNTSARDRHGWQVELYSTRGWLITNIPTRNGGFEQYIYNTVTPGWFKMTKPAICWHGAGSHLHFGGKHGKVWHADTGTSDNGEPIVGYVQFGWTRFGTSSKKRFTMMRLNFFSDGVPRPYVGIKTDYDDSEPTQQPSALLTLTGAEWDQEDWDVAQWGGGTAASSRWVTVSGSGIVAAPRLRVSTANATMSIASVDVTFEVGGVL